MKQHKESGQAYLEWMLFSTLALLITVYAFAVTLRTFQKTLAARQSVFAARRSLSKEEVISHPDLHVRLQTLERGAKSVVRYGPESADYSILYPNRKTAAFPYSSFFSGW